MSSKKSVLFGVVVLLIMFSVLLVNAGWFQTITGKASDSTAKVKVTGSAAPPIIIHVTDPNRTNPADNTLNLFAKGLGSGPNLALTYMTFNFTAYSPAGNNFLPQLPADVTSFVSARINRTIGTNTFVIPTCSFDRAVSDLSAILPVPGVFAGLPGVRYTCTFAFSYYFEPTPGLWVINATLSEVGGGKQTSNATQNFMVNPNPNWDNIPKSMNWSNLQVGDPTPRAADFNMSFYNYGNVIIGTGTSRLLVNATSLMGVDRPLEFINSSNFTVIGWPANPCVAPGGTPSTVRLFQDAPGSPFTNNFNVDFKTSTDTNPTYQNISFCIYHNNIQGISAQDYTTPAARKWILETR
jgi:hypothetical protein